MVDTFLDGGDNESFCSSQSAFLLASSSVAGAVGMTTSGESESDDSEMGRLQGIKSNS